jgi:hypothetical protein
LSLAEVLPQFFGRDMIRIFFECLFRHLPGFFPLPGFEVQVGQGGKEIPVLRFQGQGFSQGGLRLPGLVQDQQNLAVIVLATAIIGHPRSRLAELYGQTRRISAPRDQTPTIVQTVSVTSTRTRPAMTASPRVYRNFLTRSSGLARHSRRMQVEDQVGDRPP